MLIVLASVLKSCRDVRLYHKIAQSLAAQLPDAAIEVWGQGNLFDFTRLGKGRIWANLTFFRALWRARPDLVVVATFELLPAGVLYKWLFGGRLAYDVQENYVYNVLYTHVFPAYLRHSLAFVIRLIERCAFPFVDFAWVAEACYLEEMPFLRKKGIFLPNRVLQASLASFCALPTPTAGKLRLLYSGNVSADYGVLEAVRWAGELSISFELHIVGHCPRAADRQVLEEWARKYPFLQLDISPQPLPYARLLEAMAQADWLIMPYQINKSVSGRIPTKFYEALALGKRMIITRHAVWQDFMTQFAGAVVLWVDFSLPAACAEEIQDLQKISPTPQTEGVFWEMPLSIF